VASYAYVTWHRHWLLTYSMIISTTVSGDYGVINVNVLGLVTKLSYDNVPEIVT
jgi:hypothetical protein